MTKILRVDVRKRDGKGDPFDAGYITWDGQKFASNLPSHDQEFFFNRPSRDWFSEDMTPVSSEENPELWMRLLNVTYCNSSMIEVSPVKEVESAGVSEAVDGEKAAFDEFKALFEELIP